MCLPACGTEWQTFWTRGVCPGCGHRWEDTQCPACGRFARHEAWYRYPLQLVDQTRSDAVTGGRES